MPARRSLAVRSRTLRGRPHLPVAGAHGDNLRPPGAKTNLCPVRTVLLKHRAVVVWTRRRHSTGHLLNRLFGGRLCPRRRANMDATSTSSHEAPDPAPQLTAVVAAADVASPLGPLTS